MKLVLCDYTTSYLYLLCLLITTSLSSNTQTLFSLKIGLNITTPISQIQITYLNGTQQIETISNLISLNNLQLSNIEYGSSLSIQTTESPISFCGYILIGKYLFYTSNPSTWTDNTPAASPTLANCDESGGIQYASSNAITFKVPEDESKLELQCDEIIELYTCNDEEYSITLGSEFSFDIVTLISPLDFTGKVSITLSSPSIGTFRYGNMILNEDEQLITEQTAYSYTMPVASNGNHIETYLEVIKYYVHTNKVYRQLCNEGTITFTICGSGCQQCEYDSVYDRGKCTSCIPNYYFMEYNTRYCIPLSLKPSNYYISSGKYLLPCYYRCATCEADYISVYIQKCTSCKDSYKYGLYRSSYSSYNCYANCTDGDAYQIEYTNYCTGSCTGTSTPNDYIGIQCFADCPNLLIRPLNQCTDSCPEDSIYKYVSGDGKECVENCKDDKDYPYVSNDGKRCVQSCPMYTLDNSQCADACNSEFPYLDEENKNCMESCGSLYEIQNTKKCVKECPSDQNLYKLYYSNVRNRKCVSQCPSYRPYLNLEEKECVYSCPSSKRFYISTSLQCVPSCPDSSKYYHNRACYQRCPNSYPYIKGYTNECISYCDSDSEYKYLSYDQKRCVRNCDANQLILDNNKCAYSCTPTYPFYHTQSNRCYSTCPSPLYGLTISNNNKECVDVCANPLYPYTYVYGDIRKCTDICDGNLPYLDKETKRCVEYCPYARRKVQPPFNTCVEQCSGEYPYDYLNQCVQTCPSIYPYISEDLLRCVSYCPHKISSNGTNCVVECDGENIFTLGNKTCAASCADEYIYYYSPNATCLNNCEDAGLLYYKNELKCVDSCDSKYPYLLSTSNTCTDNCKEHNEFLYNGRCDTSCNGLKTLPPNNECVTSCQGDYEYLHYDTMTCVSHCEDAFPYYIRSTKTCYTSCQPPHQYVKEGEYECLSSCPHTHKYIKDDQICVKECNDTSSMFYYGNECVGSCEEVHAYRMGNTYMCEDSCRGEYGLLVEGDARCVRVCEGDMVKYGDTCVQSCPTEAQYVVPIANECVDTCRDSSYKYVDMNTKTCIEICGGDVPYLVINNTELKCYSECPSDFPYKIANTNECTSSCNDEYKYLYNSEYCLMSCPIGYKVSQANMQCVSSCEDVSQKEYGDTIYCVDHCSDQFPYEVHNKNICTNICTGNTKYLYGTTCVEECPPGYQSILPISETCVSSCPSELPYKNINSNYCRESCDDENAQFLDYDNKVCVNKCGDTQFEVTEIKQCHTSLCPSTYPFFITYSSYKRCVRQCDITPYVYTDYSNKECLISCASSNENKLEYEQQCMKTCPLFTIAHNGVCELDVDIINENEDYIQTRMGRSAIIERMNINIKDLVNLNKTIKGDDFLLQIYPSSLPIHSNNDTSSMVFDACEYILKREHNIDKDIIIAKFDYIDITSISNQIQYKAYDMNGNELDLTSCINATINIMYPINTPNEIKLDEAYAFYKEGIDIYNINHPFFSDICFPYTRKGYDLSLNERIDNFYSNISFCENNCVYLYLNYTHNKAVCNCKVKEFFNKDISNEHIIQNSQHASKHNEHKDKIDIIKCYKLLTEWKYIKYNISFWFFGVMNIANVIYLIVNITFELKHLYTSLNKVCKGSPPKHQTSIQHNINTNNIRIPQSRNTMIPHLNLHNILDLPETNLHEVERAYAINETYDLSHDRMVKKSKHSCDNISINNSWLSHSDKEKDPPIRNSIIKYKHIITPPVSKPQKNEIDLSTFIPIITTQHLNNLPFFIAHQYDKRSFCVMFSSFIKQRHFLFHACFRLSPLDIPSLNIMFFILYVILLFMCNALFYKKKAFALSYKGDDSYLNQFNYEHACLYGFISVMISSIIIGIIRKCMNFEKKYTVIQTEMVNDIYTQGKMLKKLLEKFKIVFGICLGVDMCIYMILWYYLSIFNIIYYGNQYKWFIYGCISIAYSFSISVIFCVIITTIRYIGISCNWRMLYNIALCLQNIYLL